MDLSMIVSLIGIVLVNGFALVSAWTKTQTEIASINVKIVDIESRLKEQEQHNNKIIDKLDEKLGKFVDSNDKQHSDISVKIDSIKDIVNDLKVEFAKK